MTWYTFIVWAVFCGGVGHITGWFRGWCSGYDVAKEAYSPAKGKTL